MRKSVLVIKTPDDCYSCTFNHNSFCYVTNNCTLKFVNCKPNWCPLKAMPEMYDNVNCDGSPFYHMCVGWNNCIDEILDN